MLVIALNYKMAIDSYVEDHSDLKDDSLSQQDWTQLCAIKDFLAPFHWVTFETEGDNVSIDKVLFAINVLISWFEKSLVSKSYLKNILNWRILTVVWQDQYASDKDFASQIKNE